MSFSVPTGEVYGTSPELSRSDALASLVNGYVHDTPAIVVGSGAEDSLSNKPLQEYAPPIDGQATGVMEDAKLKAIWDEEMKDFEPTGKPHRTTAVLMISWIAEADDLNPTAEVCELERVFKDIFHYEVIKRQISGDPRGMLPGAQVTKYLVELVEKYDTDSTLLIVYYAGHGIPGKTGGLQLAGNRQPNGPEPTARNAAAWKDSEHVIRETKGDVLLIFDCCFAGILLDQNVRSWPCYPTRRFECLAACGSQQTTKFPGPQSFTSALIWALTDLGKAQTRFTTLELQTKIMKDAPGFPKGQFVPLLERGEPCDQRLVLAPQSHDANSPMSSTASNHIDEPLLRNYMDLRFWFPSRPNEAQIANIAQRLKKLMLDESIAARHIRLQGLKNVDLERRELDIARIAVNKWKSALSWANGTSPAVEPDLISSGSRTRPSSLFSFPEIIHSATKHNQTQTTKLETNLVDITKNDLKGSAIKGNPAVSEMDSYTSNIANIFERMSQSAKWQLCNKPHAILALFGIMASGFALSYAFQLNPFALIGRPTSLPWNESVLAMSSSALYSES